MLCFIMFVENSVIFVSFSLQGGLFNVGISVHNS
jgi:hypothetical protein